MPSTVTDQALAEKIWADMKANAEQVASLLGPAAKTKKLTPEEELMLWNERDPKVSLEDIATWHGEGMSPEEMGQRIFHHREKLMASGGRALSKLAQAKYAHQMAQKSDPSWQKPTTPEALPPGFEPVPTEVPGG